MPNTSAYKPQQPARRPGGKPDVAPAYRLLVHRKYAAQWDQLAEAVGLQNAQRAWDHLANHPGQTPELGQCTKMKGMAKFAKDGWSPIYHYEASSMARIDYQFHDAHIATPGMAEVRVTRILLIDLNHNKK
ncbi:MAG: hypothetical protein L0G49_10510 [Luteococcus sp.]|uniref:hypothetical protein n=1 Tax=Luteococcus sp. TaxID=1969402 RepID=UPI002648F075|nr:hypothetical protein [Luteococcus sp.]MDN5564183.1 hypothetical protein [Luteococcus sp.]